MRYLRMLSNSVIAAALASAYVVALILALNPAVPLSIDGVLPIVATAGLFYTLNLTVVAYLLLVLRQIFSRELFSPAWISVGVLVWFGAIAAGVGAALTWRNLTTFSLVLDAASRAALERTAVALTVAGLAFVIVAFTRRTVPEGRAGSAALLVIAMAGSVAAPFAIRGRGAPTTPAAARTTDAVDDAPAAEHAGRVVVLALDGASLDFITSVTAEGRLPNFGRLLDRGAVRHLATLHPTSAETVWAAVATGKLPQKNGVHSAVTYRFADPRATPLRLLPEYCFAQGLVRLGFLTEEPLSSAVFRTQTLWAILSTHGVSVGVVGMPLTHPASAVRGFLVADTFHRSTQGVSALERPSAIYPPEWQDEAVAAIENADGSDRGDESATRMDRLYYQVAQALNAAHPVQVAITRFQSLDPIGHHFLRYAMPSEFGDVTEDERRRLGTVLERHYALIDDAIGNAVASIGPDDLLLVISPFGMVPLPLAKRVVEQLMGDPDLSGTHDTAPDGFLIAYGTAVARGRTQTPASVVDVVPTLLYFLGLPIGRDMDGFARTDLFTSSFTQDKPITYIPTYDH